eukprot:TRINITY_DN2408_c0_g1_i1.p1 TRINITY_DN2408_c0_g1~~TRINITY_DN2408_c0_g1_i1.p1  ORF type:complete len:861 (-),score=272.71 TRINITY_DN2408_c0_g1_i1:127-2640(-)
MAFKLSGNSGKEQQPKSSSFFGSLQKKAISAAAAASNAASSAGAAARQSMQAAKDTLATGSSSSSSDKARFNPPPRVDEDLQRALENSMNRATFKQAAAGEDAAEGDAAKGNPQFLAGVEQLQSMGFAKDLAEVALGQTRGDVFAASSLLLGEDMSSPPGSPSKQAETFSSKALDDSVTAEVTEFVRGDRVVVHSLTGSHAKALNGCQGRVLDTKDDFCKGRILIEVDGMPKLLKAENLRKAPPAMSMQSQAKASYDSAKATLLSVKRRAEAMFYTKSTGSASSPNSQAGFNASSTSAYNKAHEHPAADGSLSLQAAERRLQEARSRNAGTMDDWRRYRLEQEMARRTGPTRSARVPTTNPVAQHQTDAEDNLSELRRERDADEEEDLQRALVASMAPASTATEAATGADQEPRAADEEETLVAVPAEELEPEEADPDLFELRLREAMAEEELELQLALAASLEAECAAIQAEDEVPPAGAAACSSTDTQGAEDAEKVTPVTEDPATVESPTKQARLSDNLLQRQKLQQEQEALQTQLAEIRAAVAQHGDDEKHDSIECSFEETKHMHFDEKVVHGQEKEHQETHEVKEEAIEEKERGTEESREPKEGFKDEKELEEVKLTSEAEEQKHQETHEVKEETIEEKARGMEESKDSKEGAKDEQELEEDKLTSATEESPLRHKSGDAQRESYDEPKKDDSKSKEGDHKELGNLEPLHDLKELKREEKKENDELEEGKPDKSKLDSLLEEKGMTDMQHEEGETKEMKQEEKKDQESCEQMEDEHRDEASQEQDSAKHDIEEKKELEEKTVESKNAKSLEHKEEDKEEKDNQQRDDKAERVE